MTKTEFLQQLYNALSSLPASERDDILADFEEHFAAGAERGKSEEQICAELGNPYTCALQYLRTAESTVPPHSAAQPTPVPPMYGTQRQSTAAPVGKRVNIPWAIAFFAAALLAIGILPTCATMVFSPIFILIATIFMNAVLPAGGAVIGLLVSVGVMLCAAGVFGILVTVWFLKLSYRRADF